MSDTTTHYNLPKPRVDGRLEADVARLRAALDGIDAALQKHKTGIANAATAAALNHATSVLAQTLYNKVSTVNGTPGPNVVLTPADIGLGEIDGPEDVRIGYDAQGRVIEVLSTTQGKLTAQALAWRADGLLDTITTTYQDRTRVETVHYDGEGRVESITAEEEEV